MFVLKKIGCRAFQLAFRAALPILSYREPSIVPSVKDEFVKAVCDEIKRQYGEEPLGTVVVGLFGDVSEVPAARKVAVRCMKECIDVGHAAGAEFAPVHGKNITALFYYRNALKRAFAMALIPIVMKKHRNIEPSMLQDLKKGKPCEADAINGVVCEWGRICGVKTPINDRIVEVIKRCQSGEPSSSAESIKLFDDLL